MEAREVHRQVCNLAVLADVIAGFIRQNFEATQQPHLKNRGQTATAVEWRDVARRAHRQDAVREGE